MFSFFEPKLEIQKLIILFSAVKNHVLQRTPSADFYDNLYQLMNHAFDGTISKKQVNELKLSLNIFQITLKQFEQENISKIIMLLEKYPTAIFQLIAANIEWRLQIQGIRLRILEDETVNLNALENYFFQIKEALENADNQLTRSLFDGLKTLLNRQDQTFISKHEEKISSFLTELLIQGNQLTQESPHFINLYFKFVYDATLDFENDVRFNPSEMPGRKSFALNSLCSLALSHSRYHEYVYYMIERYKLILKEDKIEASTFLDNKITRLAELHKTYVQIDKDQNENEIKQNILAALDYVHQFFDKEVRAANSSRVMFKASLMIMENFYQIAVASSIDIEKKTELFGKANNIKNNLQAIGIPEAAKEKFAELKNAFYCNVVVVLNEFAKTQTETVGKLIAKLHIVLLLLDMINNNDFNISENNLSADGMSELLKHLSELKGKISSTNRNSKVIESVITKFNEVGMFVDDKLSDSMNNKLK